MHTYCESSDRLLAFNLGDGYCESFGSLLARHLACGLDRGVPRSKGPWKNEEFAERIGTDGEAIRRWMAGEEVPRAGFPLRMSSLLFGGDLMESADWKRFVHAWRKAQSATKPE